MGMLISLQELQKFSVLRLKGYGLGQLRDINNLGGILSITNLENATGKVEALESKLHQKRHLEGLRLNSSFHGEDSSHLDVFEGLMPPPGLKFLLIWGYKSSAYPSWLLNGSYFDNLNRFCLYNCNSLQYLPPNAELLRHCSHLSLRHVPNLKTLPCLPRHLEFLQIAECPLLMFVCNDKLEQHDEKESR